MGRGVILMKNQTHINFDISNLFAKKEVIISKEEIVEIVYFAIQNGIVKVEVTQCNDVEADENFIELQATGVMKLGYTSAVENVLIKPFDYKEEDDCSSCHGEGEYEVSAGTHSFFQECHCQKETLTLDEHCSCGTSIYEKCECE